MFSQARPDPSHKQKKNHTFALVRPCVLLLIPTGLQAFIQSRWKGNNVSIHRYWQMEVIHSKKSFHELEFRMNMHTCIFLFFFSQTCTLLRFCCVSTVSLREGDEWFWDSLWWLSSPAETSSHFHFCCFFAHFPTQRRWHNDYCHQQDCLAIRNKARPIFFSSLSCYYLIYAGV